MNAVDANVLVYAIDTSEPRKRGVALDLFDTAPDLVLPWQAACECGATFRKLEERGISRSESRQFLRAIMKRLPVIVPNYLALERALDLQERYSLSFWDANLVAACLEAGVTRLYSEDITGYAIIDGLEFVNPFAPEKAP
jgi:predicted nucleic acid-binding protein